MSFRRVFRWRHGVLFSFFPALFLIAADAAGARPIRFQPCLSAAAVDFGQATIGREAESGVEIRNRCGREITVRKVKSGPSRFRADLPASFRIPAGSSRILPVFFTPENTDLVRGRFTLFSNEPRFPYIVVAAIGEGGSPPLAASPDRLEATIAQGQSAVRTLALRNDGDDSILATLRSVTDRETGTPGTGSSRMNVLYLQTLSDEGYITDFMWNLRTLENVADLTVYPAFDSTPALEYLKRFDMVLVAAADEWADPVAAGDRLADYVDAGGKVCLMHLSLSSFPGRGLGGRIATPEYSPVAPGGNGGTGYYGSTEDHPIMEGITPELTSHFIMAVTETQGASASLGRYDNGNLIGAVNTLKPVAFINIHPWDGDHSWQTIPLLGNVFDHLGGFHIWLQPQSRDIALAPGETVEIPVIMGLASGPSAGTHSGRVEITFHSQGASGSILVPAALTVQAGAAATALSMESGGSH